MPYRWTWLQFTTFKTSSLVSYCNNRMSFCFLYPEVDLLGAPLPICWQIRSEDSMNWFTVSLQLIPHRCLKLRTSCQNGGLFTSSAAIGRYGKPCQHLLTDVSLCVHCWMILFVLSIPYQLYNLQEKDTQSKLDVLFRKNLYNLAIKWVWFFYLI